ncbi:alkaline phosphatase PhoX [Natronomonas sp. EA1]|uniref:alkaline phosphatase PhoX n=1 Tax=Natronomonas sp. EA1 TaxID=3421655 RepID=UPI003EBCC5DC
MPERFTRRNVLQSTLLAAIATQVPSVSAAESEGRGIEQEGATLNRFAHSVPGAEITGMYLADDGQFFFNVQHPNGESMWPGYQQGAVGYVRGFDFSSLPRDFESVQLPETEWANEMVRTAFGTYNVLRNGGEETDDGEPLGIPTGPDGEPLTDGNNPDFNGYIPVSENEGYLFTNWETRPGMMSRLHLERDGERLEVVGAENLEFEEVEGTWVNCFGTVTPWNTPLSSEENYAHTDTERWNDPNWKYRGGVENLATHLGHERNEAGIFAEAFPNPYRYGYILEIVDPTGDATPVKRTALGRSAHENAVVMPDEKTAYTSSDGTGKGFYKFVADTAGDLSSGTLYAAKATQQGANGTPVEKVAFTLEWVELGHASEGEIESWIAAYDDITQADYTEGKTSYITDAEVEAWAAGNADDDRVAFLETRKAAEAVGATIEFRKMEGLNIRRNAQPGEDYLYMAMSNTNATMSDDEGAIQVAGDEWGAVFRLPLEAGYNVTRMEPIVTGGPEANICGGCPYDANPNANSKACQSCAFNPATESEEKRSPFRGTMNMMASMAMSGQATLDPENTIAEPDNLLVMDDGRVVIGEDTGNAGHENNMIWVFDPGNA